MRPTYVSKEDKIKERKFAKWTGNLWGLDVTEHPEYHPIDFSGALRTGNGDIRYWMEFKVRPTYTYEDIDWFGGHMITALKVTGWHAYLAISQRPLILCVSLAKKRFYMKYNPRKKYRFKVMGRTDRNDKGDIQPHILFPMKEFKPMVEADNTDFLDAD